MAKLLIGLVGALVALFGLSDLVPQTVVGGTIVLICMLAAFGLFVLVYEIIKGERTLTGKRK